MIHKFKSNGYYLLLDVSSGTLHNLDETAYELADFAGEDMPQELPQDAAEKLGGKFGVKELRECWAELLELKNKGVLFSKDIARSYSDAGKNAPIKSMCLNVSHDCNLRCRYCFASTGDFGTGRKLMPFEVGCAALDFLFKNSGTRRNLEVDFFGGEPLMNFDVVKKLVEYGRREEKKYGKNIRFTTTTNAMLLDDDTADFISREMSNVVLSIDGRREVNDRMRPRADGTGSYDTILPKIKAFVKKRGQKDHYVRGTFTRENLDFASDVLHLADEGFTQISVEPVITDEKNPYSLREEDLPKIFAEYDRLAAEMLKRKRAGSCFNFFHFMIDLDEGPCLIKLLRGCGCGSEYVAVTPNGDIYPCHQFVGREEYILGNVMNGGIVREDLREKFSKANILTKQGCSDCWARYFCGGGCDANNSAYCGDILKPLHISCELERKRLECALMLKAAEAEIKAEAAD
jgi:uncharacterized protein